MSKFQELQQAEVDKWRHKFPGFNSSHEAYAAILEELDEFWDQVRLKAHKRDPLNMLEELVQIAALSQKAAEDLELIENKIHVTTRDSSEVSAIQRRSSGSSGSLSDADSAFVGRDVELTPKWSK